MTLYFEIFICTFKKVNCLLQFNFYAKKNGEIFTSHHLLKIP